MLRTTEISHVPMWTAATVARVCRASLACLTGFALASLSASLAQAQQYGPRTTIGTDYQQTSSVQSPNGTDPGACSADFCLVLFQQAPQQRPLVVRHVSCLVYANTGDLRYGILLTRKGDTNPSRDTYLLPVSTGGGWWAVNSPVMQLIKSGERVHVLFRNSTNASYWSPRCTISGQLKQP
jgi:hypothetical protein